MSSYTNIFGGGVVNNSNESYAAITLTASIALSWTTQPQNTNPVVENIMDIISNGAFTITMPDARQTSVGQTVLFTNVGGVNAFNVLDNAGGLIFTLNIGNARYLYLTDNATAAGTWRSVPFAAGTPSVTSVAAVSSSTNLTITGSPIIGAGTFTFNFALDLAALSGFAALTGISVRTAANTWALRTITGTANQISVTNGNGVVGQPTIALASTITGINSLTVGNLLLSANTIATTNAAGITMGDVVILPTSEVIQFMAANNTNFNTLSSGNQAFNQDYIWPTVAPTPNQVLQYGGGGALQWTSITTFGGPSTTNAIAKYADTVGSLANSGVLIDGSNNVSGASSFTADNIQIAVSDPNTISTSTLALKLIPNGTNEIQNGVNSGTPNNTALMNGALLKFMEPVASGTNFSSFTQPALSANIAYNYPSAAPALGSYMRVSGAAPTTAPNLIWDDSVDNPNILINGSMSVWQKGTSFTSSTFFVNNNDTYVMDGWCLQSNGNNVVNVSQDSGPQDLVSCAPYSAKFTVVTQNLKFGIVNFIENKDTLRVSGFNTSIGFSAKASGITNVRCALIQWSGSADAVTSSVVSAWNASGTNPTLAAGWTYSNLVTGSIVNIPVTGSFANYTINPDGLHYYTPTTGANNLAVFIWVDDTTIAAASTLHLSAVKFEQGLYSTRFIAPDFDEELMQCRRTFDKDLPYSIAVGTATYPATPTTPITSASECYWPVVSPVLTGVAYARISFKNEMRTTPTFVAYPYTTTTNTQRWSDNAGTDLAALSASTYALDSKGALIYNNVAAAGSLVTAGNSTIIGHWYASAEL